MSPIKRFRCNGVLFWSVKP